MNCVCVGAPRTTVRREHASGFLFLSCRSSFRLSAELKAPPGSGHIWTSPVLSLCRPAGLLLSVYWWDQSARVRPDGRRSYQNLHSSPLTGWDEASQDSPVRRWKRLPAMQVRRRNYWHDIYNVCMMLQRRYKQDFTHPLKRIYCLFLIKSVIKVLVQWFHSQRWMSERRETLNFSQ